MRRALGVSALRIEHIGSTAVPGLAAKPIVDLLVAVADPDDESVTVTALEAAGYELRVRELGHRMFRTPGRDVHVHVWGHSDPEMTRHLMFRDRLRRSPADRDAYERLKRELAAREWAPHERVRRRQGSVDRGDPRASRRLTHVVRLRSPASVGNWRSRRRLPPDQEAIQAKSRSLGRPPCGSCSRASWTS